jgi:RNA polymerase sigma-70 factor (ECF subfamily)
MEGSERIARYLVDFIDRMPKLTILERTVNGQPGLVLQMEQHTATVVAFSIADDRIKRLWAARNPDKLRPWTIDSRGRRVSP